MKPFFEFKCLQTTGYNSYIFVKCIRFTLHYDAKTRRKSIFMHRIFLANTSQLQRECTKTEFFLHILPFLLIILLYMRITSIKLYFNLKKIRAFAVCTQWSYAGSFITIPLKPPL